MYHLAEKHEVRTLPEGLLLLCPQRLERVLVGQELPQENHCTDGHAHEQHDEHAGHRADPQRLRFVHVGGEAEARHRAVPLCAQLVQPSVS